MKWRERRERTNGCFKSVSIRYTEKKRANPPPPRVLTHKTWNDINTHILTFTLYRMVPTTCPIQTSSALDIAIWQRVEGEGKGGEGRGWTGEERGAKQLCCIIESWGESLVKKMNWLPNSTTNSKKEPQTEYRSKKGTTSRTSNANLYTKWRDMTAYITRT